MRNIAYGLDYTQFNYKDYPFKVVASPVFLSHVIFRFFLDYYLLETAVPTNLNELKDRKLLSFTPAIGGECTLVFFDPIPSLFGLEYAFV